MEIGYYTTVLLSKQQSSLGKLTEFVIDKDFDCWMFIQCLMSNDTLTKIGAKQTLRNMYEFKHNISIKKIPTLMSRWT